MPYYPPASASGAPIDATYITQTANGTLTAEQNLAALATGLLKSTTTTGALSIGVAGTDYPGLAFANVFTAANRFEGATSSFTPLTVKTTNDDDANPLFRLINSANANLSYFDSEGKLYFLENGASIASGKQAIWYSAGSGAGIRIQSSGQIKLRPNNADVSYVFDVNGLTVGAPTKSGRIAVFNNIGSNDDAAVMGEYTSGVGSGHFYGVRGHITGAGGASKSSGYFSSGATGGPNYGVYVADINTSSGGNHAIFTNAGLVRLGDQLSVIGSQDIIQAIIKAHSTQTTSLLEIQDNSGNIYSKFNKAGYFMTKKIAVPADADLATSEMAIWFDDTAGAAKLMIKAKNASGTVVTGNVALA